MPLCLVGLHIQKIDYVIMQITSFFLFCKSNELIKKVNPLKKYF